jgi:hypothetical protein
VSVTWRLKGTDAIMTPVRPPTTKITTKPSVNSRGVRYTGLPSQSVASQQKI